MTSHLAQTGPRRCEEAAPHREPTPRETRLIDAIAAGAALMDGARAAGISYRTAKRWHRKPHIARAIRARTTESLSQARAVLASGARRAATELVRLAANAQPDSARVAASRSVIEAATRTAEIEELESRLTEIEAAVAAGRDKRR